MIFHNMEMRIDTGKWSVESLDEFMRRLGGAETNSRIDEISAAFLDTPYRACTLGGGPDAAEILTLNLAEVDCFTFLDYVEAMRRSRSYSSFVENLKSVRYKNGEVSFRNRNHFFTDWAANNGGFIESATNKISGPATAKKILNLKADGSQWVEGIEEHERIFSYIPAEDFCLNPQAGFPSITYAGIYSELDGLDVTHVGIIIGKSGGAVFRHASSDKGKVVDEDFKSYIKGKPGLLLYRPLT